MAILLGVIASPVLICLILMNILCFPFLLDIPLFSGGVRRSLERIYSTHEGLGVGGKCVKSGSVY